MITKRNFLHCYSALIFTLMGGFVQAEEPKKITIAYFADSHASLEEHPELFWNEKGQEEIVMAGGFARLFAANEQIRK